MTVVAVSGYFNPLHVGHLRFIHAASQLGDRLVVIVNNDRQVALKGSCPFMPEEDRLAIVAALRDVDRAVLSIDADRSVRATLEALRPDVFANGGDADEASCLEQEVCDRLGIRTVFGVGGREKVESSSRLIGRAAVGAGV